MKYPALRQPNVLNIPLKPVITGLGIFSLALGLAELLAPRQVSRGAGMHKQNSLLRGYGLREIGTGIGLLVAKNPRPWLWGRVAGDVVDVATVAITADPRKPARLGISSLALLAVGMADIYSALVAPSSEPQRASGPRKNYAGRSGFSKPASEMRGAALKRGQQSSPQQRSPRPQAAE